MSSELAPLLWPASRLGEALLALAEIRNKKLPSPEWDPDWLEAAARTLDFEAQPVEIPYADLERHLQKLGPALLHVFSKDGDVFLAVLPGSAVLTPAGKKVR